MATVRLRAESWSYSSPQAGSTIDIEGCMSYIIPCLDRVQKGCTKHLLDGHMVKLALGLLAKFGELGEASVTVVTDFAPTWAPFPVYVTELNLTQRGGSVGRKRAEVWKPGRRSRFEVRVSPVAGRPSPTIFPESKEGLRRTLKDVDGKPVYYYM